MLIDENLLALDSLWAAAGHPHAVFNLSLQELIELTGTRRGRRRVAGNGGVMNGAGGTGVAFAVRRRVPDEPGNGFLRRLPSHHRRNRRVVFV